MKPLTIELGVFVDDALWLYFKKIYGLAADGELFLFVTVVINNVGFSSVAKSFIGNILQSNFFIYVNIASKFSSDYDIASFAVVVA